MDPQVSALKSALKDMAPEPTKTKEKKKKVLNFAEPEEPKKDSNANQKKARIAPASATSKPEWYEDLDDMQVRMFKEVFEMLDRDGGGSIDAEELYSVMKDLDIAITLEEIRAVLKELDHDGNGEIDFDEFLFAMCETNKYLDALAADPDEIDEDADQNKAGYTRRQTLFFTAITKFAIKNSLGEIERYYAAKARKVPHVISHYTAGARLVGLNDKQLESAMRRMQIDAKKYDSPYAKPLPFVLLASGKKRKNEKRKNKTETNKTETKPVQDVPTTTVNPAPDPTDCVDEVKTPRTRRGGMIMASNSAEQLITMLGDLANKGSVVARLPDVHLVPQIRKKLESGWVDDVSPRRSRKRSSAGRKSVDHEVGDVNRETLRGLNHAPRLSVSTAKRATARGWRIPRMQRAKAPLPVIHMKQSIVRNPTIEDVPLIRKKISSVLDQYYTSLRRAHVRTAWKHWGMLYTDEIRSKRMFDNFRRTYRAYSPHKLDEVFVICPWIPGPDQSVLSTPASRVGTSHNVSPVRRAITPAPGPRSQPIPTPRPRSTPV